MSKKIVDKSTKNSVNQKYIIIAIALGLAALGYIGYRSMLTKPDINKIDTKGPVRFNNPPGKRVR